MKSSARIPPEISVRNLQGAVKVNVARIRKFAQNAVRLCLQLQRPRITDLQKLPEISILIVSDRRMATLHRQFLNEIGPTDVLTFHHGEIFVNAQMARRNSRRFGNSPERELRLYLVHGLLHLHGFNDRTATKKREMTSVQDRICDQACSLN
jgi:probable rRNA maturation factor